MTTESILLIELNQSDPKKGDRPKALGRMNRYPSTVLNLPGLCSMHFALGPNNPHSEFQNPKSKPSVFSHLSSALWFQRVYCPARATFSERSLGKSLGH
jgi:hypothetical protein